MNNSIVIIGDLHLNSSTPVSRIDDYANTSIEKLETLLDICVSRKYNKIILLGDVTHKYQQPLSYIYKVMEVFNRFKTKGITIYSIVGNHDVPYDKTSYLNRTALGLLFQSNLIKHLKEESFIFNGYRVKVFGYDYEDIIQPVRALEDTGDINICVCHRYYNYSYSNTSLTKNNIIDLDYDIYCTGHEHQPYELTKVDNKLVVRPGRFMRGTADNYNIEDTSVYMDVIKFTGEKSKPSIQIIREIIPTKSPSEIFSTKSLSKDNSDKVLSSLSEKVSSLLDKMDFKDSSNNIDVYQVLDELVEVDTRIKNRIETYLQAEGINRNKIDL